MEDTVVKDKEWLEKNIRDGLEGFFQIYAGELARIGSGLVMAQILQSACCERAGAEGDDEGTLSILIRLPRPSDSADEFFRIGSEALGRDAYR